MNLLIAIGLPAVAGLVLLVLATGETNRDDDGRRRRNLLSCTASLLTVAVTLAFSLAAALGRDAVRMSFVVGSDAALATTGLGGVLLPIVVAVGLLTLIFAVGDGVRPAARFHGLMLVFLAAVIVTVTAQTLPVLLLAWEIMGATSYALIGFTWTAPAAVSAGLTAFLTTRVGDLGLYLAAGAAVAAGTGLGLDDLSNAAAPWAHVMAAGFLLAGLGKAAQLPFSHWLSGAMHGPAAVSALLHSAAMVAMGGYLLLRMHPLLAATGWAAPTTAWIGAATAIVLGVVALAQSDVKQLLAASTASQLGFVVLAAGVGATVGGAAQLVAHAATKALLFIVAGAWLTAVGTKQLSGLRGIARRWPLVGILFVAGAVTLGGLPPFSIWFTKDAVLGAAAESNPMLYVAGLVGVALSAAYAAKAATIVLSAPTTAAPREWDAELPGTRRITALAVAPMIVLTGAALLLGVLMLPPVATAFATVIGVAPEPALTAAGLGVAAVVALIAAAVASRYTVPRWSLAADWMGLQRAVDGVLVQPVDALARHAARIDDLLAAAVQSGADVVLRAAAITRAVDERAIGGGGVGSVVRVAAGLARVASASQTGRVHQYYLGLAAGLAAAIVLLLVVS